MWAWRVTVLGVLAVGLVLAAGCGHQSAVPAEASGVAPAGDEDQLPFDREGQEAGISPTSAVIPPGANVPAGTPVTVRLQSVLSSTRQRAGDTFHAVLDEPIVVNGQTVAERGSAVTGHVVEAAPAGNSSTPGYLRLALTSIVMGGKVDLVETSSTFAKGGRRDSIDPTNANGGDGRGMLRGAAAGSGKESVLGMSPNADRRALLGSNTKDVSIGPERRLTFRLTEAVPLEPQEP